MRSIKGFLPLKERKKELPKVCSPSRLPVSVPIEFLPVPIAAQVGVQRYVRPQSYQSQFLWNCSQFLWPVPMAVPIDSSQFLWLPRWGCKGMFALKVTSLSSSGIPPSSYSCPGASLDLYSAPDAEST